MSTEKLSDLLEEIDNQISDYVRAAASVQPEITFGPTMENLQRFLEHGAYPPTDPRTRSGAALMSIALRQKEQGGDGRLADVLTSYGQRYGAERSAILNARWHYLAEQ